MKEYTCSNCGCKLSLDDIGAFGMGKVHCIPCTKDLSMMETILWSELITHGGMMSESECMTLKRTVWNTWKEKEA